MKDEMKGKVKTKNIFWGVFLILAAALLIMNQMGLALLEGIGFFSILFAVAMLAVLIEGIVHRSFGKILFALAFLCIIFDDQLGITKITPWTVLLAALLGTVGLNLIFKKKRQIQMEHYQTTGTATRTSGEKDIVFHTRLGAAVKYVQSENFEYAALDCSMGHMKVYFDHAVVQKGNATIQLDVAFGALELYVPKHWTIINHADVSFGTITEENQNQPTGNVTVTLTGRVNFGAVEITYV